ncbi:GTP cyclohydrolase II [Alphaproteobacteria bacterium]|jgi:GTP cyclohydrolase II|nr:GTP cyclohydrolase II [Alphaproteobacteria bacterium]
MHNINLTVKIERAISELRRGGKVVISDNNTGISVLLMSSELIQLDTVDTFSEIALSRPNIILSANRSKAIGIKSDNKPCSILINKNWSLSDIMSLSLPLSNQVRPEINGVVSEKENGIVSASLLLLRQARLLPSGLMSLISAVSLDNIDGWSFKNNLIKVDLEDIIGYEKASADSLIMEVRAKVPIAYTDNCEIIVFRPKDGGDEHFCLIFGKTRKTSSLAKESPLVRIHSQCITGDILNSLKCDCGEQLKASIKLMADADEGVLIYLSQEGRDIGLLNKLRAYSLQENGIDTVQANEDLGFNDDERLYFPAKEILSQLKINKIRLITNNPKKVTHLTYLGINITERIPIKINPNKHNKKYLDTKQKKSGHLL